MITVGASTSVAPRGTRDDDRAPWSAYGRTPDGFWKPEICAPGRYMVGPIPTGSTLAAQKADKLVEHGYIRALRDVVRGAGDLGRGGTGARPEPELDARSGQERTDAARSPGASGGGGSCGVGQVNAVQSVLATTDTPNPNQALNRFLVGRSDGTTVFDAVSWTDVSWSDVSWDAVSWSDVSWSDVSWDAVSWSDVSWTDVSWSDVSWSDVSWEDNADGEVILDGDGYELTPTEAEAAAEDVDLLTPDEKAALAAAQEAAAAQAAEDAAAAGAAAAADAASDAAEEVRPRRQLRRSRSARMEGGPACRPHPHPIG